MSGDFEWGGCKLTIDGSPQGFTALRDRPYYAPVGNYPPGYSGYARHQTGAGPIGGQLVLRERAPDPGALQW